LDCFLRNDPGAYGAMINMVLPILRRAIHQGRSDLVIHFLDLSEDDTEVFYTLFERNEDNLVRFGLLQNAEFEREATKYHITDEQTQKFKKAVHESLVSKGKTLLPALEEIVRLSRHAITEGVISEEDFLVLNAKVAAHLEFAFEQKDVNLYAQNINMILDQLVHAYQSKRIDLILDRLDLNIDERTAMLIHLQQKDRAAMVRTLVEANLREQEMNFYDKGGVRFAPAFRLDVYEQLNVVPSEVYSSTKDHVVMGVEPLSTSITEHAYIAWFKSKGSNLDLQNPFLQANLGFLAKHQSCEMILGYLKSVNTPKATEVHDVLKELYLKNHLAHRFALTAKSTTKDITFSLEGAHQEVMVRAMQGAFSKFIGKTSTLKDLIEGKLNHKIDEKNWQEFIHKVQLDIKSIMLRNNAILMGHQLEEGKIVNIPVDLRVSPSADNPEGGYHAVSLTFVDDLCFAADRSRPGRNDPQGIQVFQVGMRNRY
jgi:hypothetical protein